MAELDAHVRRRTAAWDDKVQWNALYGEAWTWAVPYRKPVDGPTGSDKGAERVAHLMDSTAVVSTLRGAARMQQDLFPPGQAFFRLRQTALNKLAIRGAARKAAKIGPLSTPEEIAAADQQAAVRIAAVDRQLEEITEQVRPYFQTGEWDNSTNELCVDIYVGKGVQLYVEGTRDDVLRARPVRFVTLPIDECAFELGAYGDDAALYWKTKMARREILAAFPKGVFPQDFREAADDATRGGEKVTLYQDYVQETRGKYLWKLIVTVDGSDVPVATQRYKTQPFAAVPYFKVPGETHGRGPVLLAVPTIRTLNRAMELMLKSFALSMLGIWGYRPGGTFNPATVSKQPGAFWPMQATGGVMGPDVFRLDTGGGRAEMSASFILQELRTQIQAALHDESLPDGGATPKSAAEIVARMSRVKQNWAGAFGRMINALIPVAVRRVIEILANVGALETEVPIDQLLVTVEVISPLAEALKADAWRTTVEAMQLVAATEGPQGVAKRFKLDEMMPEMIKDLGTDARWVRDAAEAASWDEKRMAAAQQQALAASVVDQPKAWTDAVATATRPAEQGAAA